MKIREKKIALLTRVRANFTTSATLTFKRSSGKNNFFSTFLGIFSWHLQFFPSFFRKVKKIPQYFNYHLVEKLRSKFVSVNIYPIFPESMLTCNPMGKKQVI